MSLPTDLNLDMWDFYLRGTPEGDELADFIRFGFPMGYMGPTTDTKSIPNHKRALDFPLSIDKFVKKELDLGGLVGPFNDPPFSPWMHISPLMSREKRNTSERRVIIDMTVVYIVSHRDYTQY